MDSILNCLSSKEEWQEFYLYKEKKNQLSKKELEQLKSFIADERFLEISSDLHFGYPVKKEISKLDSSKKRTVYTYGDDESWILKFLAYKLYKYDYAIPDSCYSFRRSKTAKNAFDRILSLKDPEKYHVLKLDIHNYFNSINVEKLIVSLKEVITDDEALLDFLCGLLRQNKCYCNGELIEEERGAMAGVPLASFFANIYLKDLDISMEQKGIPYFRYSDDIIAFFETMDELDAGYGYIQDFLDSKDLKLNPDKYKLSLPGEKWEFLGFAYIKGKIDLSDATIRKMQGKIRRKAHKLYRWRCKKDADFQRAARAMISSFDHKFYDLTGTNDFTWIRFYFPVINCSDGLKRIDEYMVKYIRYLYSGRHYKGNYRISYEEIKKLGYTPLAAEYYRWKKENKELGSL